MNINTVHTPHIYIHTYCQTHTFIIHTTLRRYICVSIHLSILTYLYTYMLVCIKTDRHQFPYRNNFHTFSLETGSNTATCEQDVYITLCFNFTSW